MILPRFEYLTPKSLEEACQLLARLGPGARVLAGGTDLLVKMKQGLLTADYLVSLKEISGLDRIEFRPEEGLAIGARASLNSLIESPLVKRYCPALAEAAATMASVQVRNTGTLGGNLCNASPAADTAPVLLVAEARVRIKGRKNERTMDLERFFTGPHQTALAPGEILTELLVPPGSNNGGAAYVRFGLRRSSALAVVSAAALVRLEGDICQKARIALGAVAPIPVRANGAEKVLEGKKLDEATLLAAARAAMEEARPISDIRGSQEYRRELVKVLTKRALVTAFERAQGKEG